MMPILATILISVTLTGTCFPEASSKYNFRTRISITPPYPSNSSLLIRSGYCTVSLPSDLTQSFLLLPSYEFVNEG
ncbi:hypothetical protein DFS33DRAFT_1336967 [Desarmillaria ectypa]|nr:hypothetical protein DFS33DRAFT_1336967 [Desarmillaria ectypa]